MSRALSDLAPAMLPACEAFLAACQAQGFPVLVTQTRRTLEEQAALKKMDNEVATSKRRENAMLKFQAAICRGVSQTALDRSHCDRIAEEAIER